MSWFLLEYELKQIEEIEKSIFEVNTQVMEISLKLEECLKEHKLADLHEGIDILARAAAGMHFSICLIEDIIHDAKLRSN